MSHEIRTPLNAIIGFSQLMNRDPMLTDTQKEYNFSIIRAGEHLLALINDILELSKIEAGRIALNPNTVDLHYLFKDIQIIFKERTQSKKLQFIFEMQDNVPRYVVIDESKLRQVFINLIGNAVKFTDEGGIAVRIRSDKTDADKIYLMVEIQDSGPGVSEQEMSKLFKHFEQTSVGVKKGSGTGLGLALSREFIRLMGGDIRVESEVGKGSLFAFHVEIQEGQCAPIEEQSAKRVVGIGKGQDAYRILVVDDKEDNLKIAVNLLKMIGFETNEAVNGKEAIQKFEEWNPHLILMDMRMPVMDGYEATRRIKSTEKGKNTPIIVITASAFEDERIEIESLNVQDFIRKPFRENELFHTIGKILGVTYIYDKEALSATPLPKPISEDGSVESAIGKLPHDLIAQMQDAVLSADLDRLIELIAQIDSSHAELAQQLKNLAQNYDYDALQQIFRQMDEINT
ncbi:MAG: response regulator [Desulfobacterales bacterium]|nr:response regulator [Desulfobacterales bacterium]